MIVVDNAKHCLHSIERHNNSGYSYSTFAGICNKPGFVNGPKNIARFRSPVAAIFDQRNTGKLLLTESSNFALRTIDVQTGKVDIIFVSANLYYADVFASRPIWDIGVKNNSILAPVEFGVLRFSFPWLNVTLVSGGDVRGDFDGNLIQSLYDQPLEMVVIDEDIYIVLDQGNHKLRVVDAVNNRVTSICTGNSTEFQEGFSDTCEIPSPITILHVEGIIYIGLFSRIVQLPGNL